MTNSSLTRVELLMRHGISRSTAYFGGGTRIWVIALIPMIGTLNRLSETASERPPLECSRLWNLRRRHSAWVRSSDRTACRVWALMVSGFGKHHAVPREATTVMSSD